MPLQTLSSPSGIVVIVAWISQSEAVVQPGAANARATYSVKVQNSGCGDCEGEGVTGDPWQRQVRELCERYGTDDIDEAIRREADMEMTKSDILAAKAEQLRREGQHPKPCIVEGCGETRREGKVRCDRHQREYQNESYRASKAKKPPLPEKAKVDDPRPVPEDYRPPIADRQVSLTIGQIIGMVADARVMETDREARAYVAGYIKGREAA